MSYIVGVSFIHTSGIVVTAIETEDLIVCDLLGYVTELACPTLDNVIPVDFILELSVLGPAKIA
jgi:hypothetical protein